MVYDVTIPGMEDHHIQAKIGFWGRVQLLLNGVVAHKGQKKNELILPLEDGASVVVRWKPRLAGLDFPKLFIGDKEVDYLEPLLWYQWIWIGWPAMILFSAVPIGLIPGLIVLFVNLRLMRSSMHTFIKYCAIAFASLVIIAGFLYTILLLV